MNHVRIFAIAFAVAFGGLVGATVAFDSSAEAAVCARGVYRAGCAGPRGAVAVRRAPVVRPMVAPRRAVIVR